MLKRIRAGDSTALDELLRAQWSPLVAFLERLVGARDAAEDVAQEAFVRLWEHRERHHGGGSPEALLYRIARNAALDLIRTRDTRQRLLGEHAPFLGDAPTDPDEELHATRLAGRLEEAVATLPPRRREVFLLTRFGGLAYQEVADVMEISAQTVANQMSLALADLRTLLSDVLAERDEGIRHTPDSEQG